MNDTLNIIKQRASCRFFTPEMPTDEQLQRIAEAAIQSPSSSNRQRWRVVVVKNKDLIDEMQVEAMNCVEAMPDKKLLGFINGRGNGVFCGAPCMIMVPMESAEPVSSALDCGILCENICIAAESLGVGSLICGLARLSFLGEKRAKFEQAMGFPEGYEFGMAVLLGTPAKQGTPHVPDMSKISFIE